MRVARETLEYVAISAGMALACASFTVLSSLFAVASGGEAVVAVVLAGSICGAVSFSIAELASMYPSAPGIGTYLRIAIGRRFALSAVFMYIFLLSAIAGVESYVFSQIIGELFPSVPSTWCVLALFGLVVSINLLGIEQPRTMQLGTTVLLVLAILGISIFAGMHPPSPVRTLRAVTHPIGNVIAATGVAVFLYMGFEWVMPLGRSPKSYRVALPLSMPIALAVLALAYGAFAAAINSQLSPERLVGTAVPQIALAAVLFEGYGRHVAVALSVLATFGAFNAGLMGGARMVYSLAREGSLPRWLAALNTTTGVPTAAIGVLGTVCVIAGLAMTQFGVHLVAATVGASIECMLYGALAFAAIRLRTKKPNVSRPFRSPVPLWLQWTCLITMPLLGLAALVSIPSAPIAPAATLLVLVAVAVCLARYCTRIEPTEVSSLSRVAIEPQAQPEL